MCCFSKSTPACLPRGSAGCGSDPGTHLAKSVRSASTTVCFVKYMRAFEQMCSYGGVGPAQREGDAHAGGDRLACLDVWMSMSSSPRRPIVLNVPSPCDVEWEDMVGDERGRFCARCGKTVTNLSVLDGDEVRAVLARGECVSFLYREDASVVTAPSRGAQGTGTGATAAAVVLAATMALTLGCDATKTSDEPAQLTRAASEAEDGALESRDAAEVQRKESIPTMRLAELELEAPASAPANASASAPPAPDSVPVFAVKRPVEPLSREELRRRKLLRTTGFLDPGL